MTPDTAPFDSPVAPDLDTAAARMSDGSDASASLGFYQALAQSELFLLLAQEAAGSTILPQVFDLPSGALVLAFDSAERMAAWAEGAGLGAQAYAALPGRVIAQQIAAADGALGLGLNFGAGTASEMVLPPEAMAWLANMLAAAPVAETARIAQVLPLGPLPPSVPEAMTRGLAGAGGLAEAAVLARVRYAAGGQGHVLAFWGAAEAAQPALARAAAEALAFSGQEAAMIDVIFPASRNGIAGDLLRLGLPLPLPMAPPLAPETQAGGPRAPGMDPATPPKLR